MRQQFNEIEAIQIESVCTRFHRQLEYLCYRIIIRYTGQTMYKDFYSYKDYLQHHDMLIRAIHDETTLPNSFSLLH